VNPDLHLIAEPAPFVMVPRWLLRPGVVGDGARTLYCVLHDLVAGREGPTRPVTRAELAQACDVSANTVDRRLTELIGVGAVEKEPQILAGGQVGNIYRVWLTPPDQRRSRVPKDGEARSARVLTVGYPASQSHAPVENHPPTDGKARSTWVPDNGYPPRQRGEPLLSGGDPTALEEQAQELPPQPPRTAGGPRVADVNTLGSRRSAGINPRALSANPRAEDQLAAITRDGDRFARLEAAREHQQAERRAAERAAAEQCQAFEAEAAALSAMVDDQRLALLVARVEQGLAGPLARSSRGLTHAVVTWCRAAAARRPGPFLAAIDNALTDEATLSASDGDLWSAVPLPVPPPGTPGLHRRIRTLLWQREQDEQGTPE
jgi:hypothetical protein